MRIAVLPPLAGMLAALVLAGCSGGDDEAAEIEPPPPATVQSAPADEADSGGAVAPQVNEGEVGDAATSSDEDEQVDEVADPIDEADAAPTDEEREGVAGGATCRNLDLVVSRGRTRSADRATLCLLNGVRRDNSLRPLRRNRSLARAARAHGRDLVRRHYFEHLSQAGTTHTDRIRAAGYMKPGTRWIVGENLAWGMAAYSAPRAIVHGWMNSPPHRRNILHTGYREIGIAVLPDVPPADKRGGATYVTEFGVRRR